MSTTYEVPQLLCLLTILLENDTEVLTALSVLQNPYAVAVMQGGMMNAEKQQISLQVMGLHFMLYDVAESRKGMYLDRDGAIQKFILKLENLHNKMRCSVISENCLVVYV